MVKCDNATELVRIELNLNVIRDMLIKAQQHVTLSILQRLMMRQWTLNLSDSKGVDLVVVLHLMAGYLDTLVLKLHIAAS